MHLKAFNYESGEQYALDHFELFKMYNIEFTKQYTTTYILRMRIYLKHKRQTSKKCPINNSKDVLKQ